MVWLSIKAENKTQPLRSRSHWCRLSIQVRIRNSCYKMEPTIPLICCDSSCCLTHLLLSSIILPSDTKVATQNTHLSAGPSYSYLFQGQP